MMFYSKYNIYLFLSMVNFVDVNQMKEILEAASSDVRMISYEDLKQLRDDGKLLPGKLYRITDYECTCDTLDYYDEFNTISADHQFDIIVMATSNSTLGEECLAAHHDGDDYFANSNLDSWKVWYCLDNDKDRFIWAAVPRKATYVNSDTSGVIYRDDTYDEDSFFAFDNWNGSTYEVYYAATEYPEVGDPLYIHTENDMTLCDYITESDSIQESGKGVIYRLIDEWGNDCPYDFKNIMFFRDFSQSYDPDVPIFKSVKKEDDVDEVKSENKTIKAPSPVILGQYYYTFSKADDYDNVYDDSMSDSRNNVMDVGCFGNVFLESCNCNTLKAYCCNNTFGCYVDTIKLDEGCQYNSFKDGCHTIHLKTRCEYNSFGFSCSGNELGDSCASNNFGDDCGGGNKLGDMCYDNNFGDNCCGNKLDDCCQSIILEEECASNNFGVGCGEITLSYNCYANYFKTRCSNIYFGECCEGNKLDEANQYITFGDYCYNNTVCSYCENIEFQSNSCLCHVLDWVSGSELPFIVVSDGQPCYDQYFGYASDGTLAYWTNASGGSSSPATEDSNGALSADGKYQIDHSHLICPMRCEYAWDASDLLSRQDEEFSPIIGQTMTWYGLNGELHTSQLKTKLPEGNWYSIVCTSEGWLVTVDCAENKFRIARCSDDDWEVVTIDTPNAYWNQLYYFDDDNILIAIYKSEDRYDHYSDTFMISYDDGATWEQKALPASKQWTDVWKEDNGEYVFLNQTGSNQSQLYSTSDFEAFTSKQYYYSYMRNYIHTTGHYIQDSDSTELLFDPTGSGLVAYKNGSEWTRVNWAGSMPNSERTTMSEISIYSENILMFSTNTNGTTDINGISIKRSIENDDSNSIYTVNTEKWYSFIYPLRIDSDTIMCLAANINGLYRIQCDKTDSYTYNETSRTILSHGFDGGSMPTYVFNGMYHSYIHLNDDEILLLGESVDVYRIFYNDWVGFYLENSWSWSDWVDVSAGGSGSGDSGMILTTYSELKSLRDTKELIPGAYYRITDYDFITDDDNLSGHNVFDIIVQAVSDDMLSEKATCATPDGLEDWYYLNPPESWSIRYTLDLSSNNINNNLSEYYSENSKGCILEMRDGYDNHAFFDFKNLKWKFTVDGVDEYYYTFGMQNELSNAPKTYLGCYGNDLDWESSYIVFYGYASFNKIISSQYIRLGMCDYSVVNYSSDIDCGKFNSGHFGSLFINDCKYITLVDSTYNMSMSACRNVSIPKDVRNAHIEHVVSGSMLTLALAADVDYPQYCMPDSNGNIKIWNPAESNSAESNSISPTPLSQSEIENIISSCAGTQTDKYLNGVGLGIASKNLTTISQITFRGDSASGFVVDQSDIQQFATKTFVQHCNSIPVLYYYDESSNLLGYFVLTTFYMESQTSSKFVFKSYYPSLMGILVLTIPVDGSGQATLTFTPD